MFARTTLPKLLMAAATVMGGCTVHTYSTPPRTAASVQMNYSAPQVRVATQAPPAPRAAVARRPAQPQLASVWIEGRWSWNGSTWVWIDGSWQTPPNSGYVWEEPNCVYDAGNYRFYPGHWRPQGAQPPAHQGQGVRVTALPVDQGGTVTVNGSGTTTTRTGTTTTRSGTPAVRANPVERGGTVTVNGSGTTTTRTGTTTTRTTTTRNGTPAVRANPVERGGTVTVNGSGTTTTRTGTTTTRTGNGTTTTRTGTTTTRTGNGTTTVTTRGSNGNGTTTQTTVTARGSNGSGTTATRTVTTRGSTGTGTTTQGTVSTRGSNGTGTTTTRTTPTNNQPNVNVPAVNQTTRTLPSQTNPINTQQGTNDGQALTCRPAIARVPRTGRVALRGTGLVQVSRVTVAGSTVAIVRQSDTELLAGLRGQGGQVRVYTESGTMVECGAISVF